MSRTTLRAIVPQKPIANPRAARRALEAAINQTLARAERDFQRTTATWKTRVKFSIARAALSGGDLVGEVFTVNQIYMYVNDGTRPHIIRPRRAARLTFRGGAYRAKTRPGVVGSGTGGASGGLVSAQSVQHPGTAARAFDKAIAKRQARYFQEQVAAAGRASAGEGKG